MLHPRTSPPSKGKISFEKKRWKAKFSPQLQRPRQAGWPLCFPSLTSSAAMGSLELSSAKHRCSAGPNAPPLPCEEQRSRLQPGSGGLSLPACLLMDPRCLMCV